MTRTGLLLVAAGWLQSACAQLGGCSAQVPVKLYFCKARYENCYVYARFKDMDACERTRMFVTAYCDQVSEPGKIICTRAEDEHIGEIYCTY